LIVEYHGFGALILLAGLCELVRPELLDAVDVADDPAVLALVRIGTRIALLECAGLRLLPCAGVLTANETGQIPSHEKVDGQNDESGETASADRETATADAASANVFDLARVKGRPWIERHDQTVSHKLIALMDARN
jgi:hypothetical protein